MSRASARGFLTALVLAFASIATASPSALSAQAAQAAPARAVLTPSPQAERVAAAAELTGIEVGTMWTFENAPLDYWGSTYDFHPTDEWLEHVRLSSVRYGEICSASFVSGTGLVVTNHHCARDCVEAVSTPETDYVEKGFYAATRDEELVCPDLYLDQLRKITDVTDRVRAAAPEGGSSREIADAQETARGAIEDECESSAASEAATTTKCQVVTLYHGGQFQLYEYRRYSPVKLVFTPELQAGFFGGDPDNFTYPRYALDVSFVRAYDADGETPATTPEHFDWNPEGAGEGDLVFITGNPGSTNRGATVGELLYERAYRHPFLIQLLEGQRSIFQTIASFGPEAERSVRDQLFGVENSLKAFKGELGGLQDTLLMGQKLRWEEEFRGRIAADENLKSEFGDVWDKLTDIQYEKMRVSPPLNVNDPSFGGGDPVVMTADLLVRYVREMAKPEAERSEAFTGDALAKTEATLKGSLGVPPQFATLLLEIRLAAAERWLEPDDAFRAIAFEEGETAEHAAARITAATQFQSAAFRASLMDGGEAALEASEDPIIRMALYMADAHDELQPRWEDLQAAETVEHERLARAQFAAFGTDLPPDATFTLRISDGVVKRYPYNGTFAPATTRIGGMYERSEGFEGEMPWKLPAKFAAHHDDVDLDTPLDFVTTNDITGGNSGSPIIDRGARVVGLAFDGNIEQLPNEFLFSTAEARTVGVHSAGITEALRSVYGADALLAELLGEGAGEGGEGASGSDR